MVKKPAHLVLTRVLAASAAGAGPGVSKQRLPLWARVDGGLFNSKPIPTTLLKRNCLSQQQQTVSNLNILDCFQQFCKCECVIKHFTK